MTATEESPVASAPPTRRTLLGAAWAVPVVIAASATPAHASSPDVPVLVFLATAIDDNGYTLVARIEHANFEVWPFASFRVELLDETFNEWIPLPAVSTDGNGDWSNTVAYQDIDPMYQQSRILFTTGGIDYPSAVIRLPPPPPTITTTIQQDVSDTWDIFTQVTPRLVGTYAIGYDVQRQDSGGNWATFTNGITDAAGAGILNVPGDDLDGYLAVRTRVVINTYEFVSDPAPI